MVLATARRFLEDRQCHRKGLRRFGFQKFSRVANLIPLEISAFTRSRGSANVEEAAENLREFLATPGFKQVSSGNSHDGGMSFEYRKEHQMCFKYETRSREDGWKMSVEYINGGLNIAVKKAAE